MDGRDPPFDLSFRIVARDYQAFLRKLRHRPIEYVMMFLPALGLGAVGAVIGAVAGLTFGSSQWSTVVAVGGALVFFLFYQFVMKPSYFRSIFSGQPMALGETKLVVDNRGVASNMGDIVLAMPWGSIVRVVETEDHVFLMYARLAAVIVPKRAFESADRARGFAAFARQMAPGRR